MSTRCQIRLFNSGIALYRHSDGYPESEYGVLETIKKTIQENPHLMDRAKMKDDSYLAFRFPEAFVSSMEMNLQETGFGLYRDTKVEIPEDIEFLYWITYEEIKGIIRFVVYHKKARNGYPTEEDSKFII